MGTQSVYRRKRVKFNYIKEVYSCVAEANKLKTVPMVRQGATSIPATSLLGMFTIDPSEPFEIEYDRDETAFEEFISRYEC